jgi:hypothetical protein
MAGGVASCLVKRVPRYIEADDRPTMLGERDGDASHGAPEVDGCPRPDPETTWRSIVSMRSAA